MCRKLGALAMPLPGDFTLTGCAPAIATEGSAQSPSCRQRERAVVREVASGASSSAWT
jgi:hypothetical protein